MDSKKQIMQSMFLMERLYMLMERLYVLGYGCIYLRFEVFQADESKSIMWNMNHECESVSQDN